MEREAFDIYRSPRGYIAVTNPTRRAILDALAHADLGLPRLVKITGKSKPTLSSIHMRALLDDALITEREHPSDARRKLYRLVARRIGMSSVSLDELRGAVKDYSTRRAREPCLTLGATLEIVSCEGTPREVVERHARLVGQEAAAEFPRALMRDALATVAAVLDQAAIARPRRLDFASNEVELELLSRAPRNVRLLPDAIAAFFEGMLRATVSSSACAVASAAPRDGILVAVTAGANVSSMRNIQEPS